jgi:hypothetical protein
MTASEWLQPRQWPRLELPNFFIVEECQHVTVLLGQLSPIREPTGDLGNSRFEDVPFYFVANNSWHRLDNDFPAVLGWTLMETYNRVLLCWCRIVKVLNSQELIMAVSQPQLRPKVKVTFNFPN